MACFHNGLVREWSKFQKPLRARWWLLEWRAHGCSYRTQPEGKALQTHCATGRLSVDAHVLSQRHVLAVAVASAFDRIEDMQESAWEDAFNGEAEEDIGEDEGDKLVKEFQDNAKNAEDLQRMSSEELLAKEEDDRQYFDVDEDKVF